MTSKLTNAQISNVTLIRLIRWADEHNSHYVAAALRELQERRMAAMDCEPAAEVLSNRPGNDTSVIDRALPVGTTLYRHAQPAPASEPVGIVRHVETGAGKGVHVSLYQPLPEGVELFAAPQPDPVVPEDVLDALQKVARMRLDLNDFDGDRRGIAGCLGDAEEALIEVVNRRAAMLQAGNSPVIGIDPASGPDCSVEVRYVAPPGYVMVPKEPTKEILDEFDSIIDYGAEDSVDAWSRLLAAAPQEAK